MKYWRTEGGAEASDPTKTPPMVDMLDNSHNCDSDRPADHAHQAQRKTILGLRRIIRSIPETRNWTFGVRVQTKIAVKIRLRIGITILNQQPDKSEKKQIKSCNKKLHAYARANGIFEKFVRFLCKISEFEWKYSLLWLYTP